MRWRGHRAPTEMADNKIIQIDVIDKGAGELLGQIAARLKDMRPVMRPISGIMDDEVQENFEQEGRPKWEDLAESTKKQRERKRHWPGKMLQVIGQLKAANQPGYDNESAWVGNNKKYAAAHNFGADIVHKAREAKVFFKTHRQGTYKGKTLFSKESKAEFGKKVTIGEHTTHIPARPFMKLTEGGLVKIKEVLGRFLVRGDV